MRIITLNANGIRAAARKGFFAWLARRHPDVVCLQETKAQQHQLDDTIFRPAGYRRYFCDAQKPGYSGTAIYTRHRPDKVHYRLGWPVADDEGRYIRVDFPGLSVTSVYLPSGSSGEARQAVKFDFMARYERSLRRLGRGGREHIICGDWNIVHRAIDIKNFKSNQKNSGCLPEEREWLDKLLTKKVLVDAFRVADSRAEQYTWWSNRGRAWEKNVGWRIDYQMITPGLAKAVRRVEIYKAERFSDHAPLVIDYDGFSGFSLARE